MNLWRKTVGFMRFLSLEKARDWEDVLPNAESGERVGQASVLGLSAAWACVNLLAGTIASLQFVVYKRGPRGLPVEAPEHPLYRVLHDSPNFDQTAIDFWEFICTSIELWGNAYARVERTDGRVVGLMPIRPDLVTVRRLENGSLEYSWSEDGRSYRVTEDQILHIRGFGGDPLGGMSTLTYGRQTFGLSQAINRAAAATFRNGMRPSVQMSFEKWLSPEQRALAEGKLAEKYLGAMNAGRPFIAEGGAKIEAISIHPEDAQMLESRGFGVEEVCRFFGVPPHMVGHTEKVTSWGTGLEQQTLGFQKFTLRRRVKRIEQAVEKQLLTPRDRADGIRVEFNFESLLRGDSAARAAFYNAGLTQGWLVINEVRAKEGLPPVEGGDVPRMQSQNVPITQAGMQSALPAPRRTEDANV